LERQIRELAAARGLESATIGQRGLAVKGTGGATLEGGGGVTIAGGGKVQVIDPDTRNTVAYVGSADMQSTSADGHETQMVSLLFRDDGSPALQLADLNAVANHDHKQALQWPDMSSRVIFADDTASGSGIANPYFAEGTLAEISPPAATTTSASFTALRWADSYTQHPKVTANVLVQTAAGTTGEIRLTVNGVLIGTALAIPANSFSNFIIPASAWPSSQYAFESRVIVQLEARRTAGTGTIGVRGRAKLEHASPNLEQPDTC
jgi:hypothetical protein